VYFKWLDSIMDQLNDLITELCACPEDANAALSLTAAAVRRPGGLLAAIESHPAPWYFLADPSLTVFATAGAPGTGSAPHSHGLWAVVACLGGQEGSRAYEVEDGQLTERGRRRLAAGEAHSLNADAIHAVFNCWSEPNIVLHVYGGDFLKSAKTVYDPLSGDSYPLGLKEPLVPHDSEVAA
jgi:predicted metal-dependent enzyme (double-stranded beta helix superfamily)